VNHLWHVPSLSFIIKLRVISGESVLVIIYLPFLSAIFIGTLLPSDPLVYCTQHKQRNKGRQGIPVKYLLFCPVLTKLGTSKQILLCENKHSGSSFATCGQTDMVKMVAT
jgi:hypothetical protein